MRSIKNVCNEFVLISSLVAVMLAACAPQHDPSSSVSAEQIATDNIIGGSIVEALDPIARSTVALIILDASNPQDVQQGGCTGTLLDQNTVLTAAHCIPARGAIIVAFTTNSREVNSFTHPKARLVRGVEVHPEAFLNAQKGLQKNYADLALLRFEGTVAPGYRPVQLLPQNRQLRNGMTAILAGFGLTDGVRETSDDLLRKAAVSISNAQFSPTETLMDETKGRGSCRGDSGGPAFVVLNGATLQFGVLSRGHNDPSNTCRGYSIYTNINAHMSWINAAKLKLQNQASTSVVAAK